MIHTHLGDETMIEEDHFRCDGCESYLNSVDAKEGNKVRYILTDFEHHEVKHFCSKLCLDGLDEK